MPLNERRPLSIQARLLIAASLALAAFLGLTGFALQRAYTESSLKDLSYRLRSHVFAYIRDTDISVAGRVLPPEFPPDSRFDRPQSGLYAAVLAGETRWQSRSALGTNLPQEPLAPGAERFSGPFDSGSGELYVYAMGVLLPWNDKGEIKELPVTFLVAEDRRELDAQLDVFRRTLWFWLTSLGLALLVLQVMVLRWVLRPLRRVAADLARVERGEADQLADRYPAELTGLTHSVNVFIGGEREQRARYRNTLANLAHSLKTPLAVVRGELEGDGDDAALRRTVAEQVSRMDEIVAYQLSRAATSGRATFAAPVPVEPTAEEIVRGLEKVYAERNVLCEFEIEAQARFYGEAGDLTELLGNLLDNAFKWARHRVELGARPIGAAGARRPGLELRVEDDGPGIPEDQVARLLQRGVRGDERVQGHGIGLAIVQDIVVAYRGELEVLRSESLGGAAFVLRFPPVA